MLPSSKWRQYGLPNMEVKGIIIHNTNNQYMNAEELGKSMLNGVTSQGTHFFVDKKKTIQVMPLEWSVFSTGRGLDFGNLHCICIEVCGDAEERLEELLRSLMGKYDLTLNDLYFHNDFMPNINCPAQIIQKYGNKRKYIEHLRRRFNG